METKYISKKSKIYLVAPSFGCNTSPYNERLNKAIPKLKSLGHEVIVGPNCFLAEGKCASNTPEKRALEFMNAYESDAEVIISVGGGEMMCEILDFIDFDKIRKLPPKWFVGFSDNTNLTFTLTTICDVHTIYGPCAGAYHFDKYTYDVKDTYDMLQGKLDFEGYPMYESIDDKSNPLADYNLDTKKVITPFNYSSPFSGTIIGGNLDIMQQLIGTPYDKMREYAKKHPEGIIFYLEACDLNVTGIKRALLQMKRAGWFDYNIKGFLVGRPLCINQNFLGINHINSVTDVLADYDVPILLDVDLGHLSPSIPIKNGEFVSIEYKNENIFFKYRK